MSNFSIKKDDFYKIIVLLAGLVSINLITFVARKEISKPHIIISSLLSAIIILSNCVGKPITEKEEEEAEPPSAIAALLPILTVIYVTACACQKFRIPFSQKSFQVVGFTFSEIPKVIKELNSPFSKLLVTIKAHRSFYICFFLGNGSFLIMGLELLYVRSAKY